MKIKKLLFIFALSVVLLCCVSAISAESNDTMDNIVSEIDDEFISVSNDEQAGDIDESESVLQAQEEIDNLTVTNSEQLLSTSDNEDCLELSNRDRGYLEDIKTSSSDEYYKFINYLVYLKGFRFLDMPTDGYTIFSTQNYESKLYDGSTYILSSLSPYFISKDRISYVIDEFYPDVLYYQNNNVYVDELYLGWLKWVECYHSDLIIDERNDGIFVSVSQSYSGNVSSELPRKFDSRNVNGQNYVTPIKNQAEAGTCWAFAAIAGLETYLLKNEGKSYEFSSKYDFSENNLKNVMSSIGREGIFTRSVIDGGNENTALAYFIRWSGPILEEFDKYDLINNKPVNNIPLEFFNSEKHVQGVKYISPHTKPLDNDEIKQAIMDYGCVVTSMWWIQNKNYETKDNYYYDGHADEKDSKGQPLNYGHEICIIGWDDDYPKDNFSKTAPGNGAFIIKNSWGNSSGNNGYYYVSYYDTQLANHSKNNHEINYNAGFSFTSVEDKTNYGKNYNYNPLGVTYWLKFNSRNNPVTSFTYYNQWVSDGDEKLKACGVYVNNVSECSVDVFVDDEKVGETTKVNLNYAGFHTIVLNKPVDLNKNQKFRIQVTVKSNTPVLVPVELPWTDFNEGNSKAYSNAHANVNESGFISGGKLVDITKTYKNCNFCINAYTEFKKLLETKIEVVHAITSSDFLIKEVTVKLLDSNNNLLKNFDLISCRSNDYQIVTTNSNGEATFVVNDSISEYLCIYYLGNEMYDYTFKPLKINTTSPKTEPPVVVINDPQPPSNQPTVNLPVSDPNLIPTTTPVITSGSVVIIKTLKISGISNGGIYGYKDKRALSLSKKVSLKIKITGNGKSYTVNFPNGKHTLDLSKYKLKKNSNYSFKFNGSDSKYSVSETKKFKTKK